MGGYILIVEDDAAMLDAVAMDFESLGWRVQRATNGAEALAAVRAELPTLILTDLEMPVMNGRRFLQLLRMEPLGHDVPVIVLSAFGYEWEAELMGAQGYVRKPVHARQLEEVVARVLDGTRRAGALLH